jgi:hypothetical protein
MAKHVPVSRPDTRVIHYVDPAPGPQELWYYTPAQLAARRHRDRILYARWVMRQAEFAEQDRRVRRFMLGFGAVLAAAIVTGLVLLVVMVYQAITSLGVGLLVVPLVILALAGLTFGGHRCITIVQHWH